MVFLIVTTFGFYVIARALCYVESISIPYSNSMFTVLLWALAYLSAGAAFGFLFGIPKVVQTVGQAAIKPKSNVEPGREEENSTNANYQQKINSNLGSVSF